jgi:hypothetical protein
MVQTDQIQQRHATVLSMMCGELHHLQQTINPRLLQALLIAMWRHGGCD